LHNQYVRNYITTGQAKILNQTLEFVAVHRDRYVVPVRLQISHVSGIGEDRWAGVVSQSSNTPGRSDFVHLSTPCTPACTLGWLVKVPCCIPGGCSVFMGVIQALPQKENVATLWVLSTGAIVACDATFTGELESSTLIIAW
jgi:hypothetical protein